MAPFKWCNKKFWICSMDKDKITLAILDGDIFFNIAVAVLKRVKEEVVL